MSRTSSAPHIAPRVLQLCQQSRSMAELLADFPASDAGRVRRTVYALVQRGLLRNTVPGKCGPHKSGRFVVTDTAPATPPERCAPRGTGIELAQAWGAAK